MSDQVKIIKYSVYIPDYDELGPDEYALVMEQHRHLSGAEVHVEGSIKVQWDSDFDAKKIYEARKKRSKGAKTNG